ncbi:uncharacterized protein A4U43_C06F13700 [Asparagus officinalis]|uniref:Uncharacterized protein n=1 Tax=Asparagus officinalis TaxID=4686 RepID=A0A5P1EMP5_ASPOF|nr:uncharacterized protein A4U43_C06F13700 [Asparagus officinalis]
MMEENASLTEDMSTIVHAAADDLALEVNTANMSISDDVLLFMIVYSFFARPTVMHALNAPMHVHCPQLHWVWTVGEVDAADMLISDDVLSFMASTRGGVTLWAIQSLLPLVDVCTINSTGDFTYSAIFRLFVGILIFVMGLYCSLRSNCFSPTNPTPKDPHRESKEKKQGDVVLLISEEEQSNSKGLKIESCEEPSTYKPQSPSPEIVLKSIPSPCKPLRAPRSETLVRWKSIPISAFSKTKSRFVEQTASVANPVHDASNLTYIGSPNPRASGTPKTPTMMMKKMKRRRRERRYTEGNNQAMAKLGEGKLEFGI